MAYTPREWSCGDKITADSLNNIEDGIQEALECCGSGSEPLIVRGELDPNLETYRLDHTWQEIYDAYPNVCVLYEDTSVNPPVKTKAGILVAERVGDDYVVLVAVHDNSTLTSEIYKARNSPTAYPYYVS